MSCLYVAHAQLFVIYHQSTDTNLHLCSVDTRRSGARYSHNQDHLSDQDQRGCGNCLHLFWHLLPLHHVPFYL